MNSHLYSCRVLHHRSRPKQHRFAYRLFMFYIDLDEEHTLGSMLRLVASKHWAPYRLETSDHYDAGKTSIKENIVSYLQENGYNPSGIGKIRLLTHLRTFGYVFNPVSFYFVENKKGEPICSIAEVDNTFNEQKLFIIPHGERGKFDKEQPKRFYVSPFSDLDTVFNFQLQKPDKQLRIAISQNHKNETNPYFRSALTGKKVPLNDAKLLSYTLRFPAITLGILLGIHWHAFRLWIKGLRIRKKADHPELQTGKHVYLKPSKHFTH